MIGRTSCRQYRPGAEPGERQASPGPATHADESEASAARVRSVAAALTLGVAQARGFVFSSFDDELNQAARAEGLTVLEPID